MSDLIENIDQDAKATSLVLMAEETKSQALSLQVRSPHEYEQVSDFRKTMKNKYNEIEGYRVHLKEPFLAGCCRIDEFFKPALVSLKQAEDTAKARLLGYESEQKRLAAEEQRKLDEQARKAREALEAKARSEREATDRKAAELQRQADEARAANDLATSVKLRNEADRVVAKSEAKAETFLVKASQVSAPKVTAYIPPVQGQFTKEVWKARVIDKLAVPEDYKIVDQSMLDKFAQATKGKVAVPGVEFFPETKMVGRS